MADNSSVPVASGNETFANKDIGGVKFPKHILYNSSGTEVVPATSANQSTANASLAAIETAIEGTLTVGLPSGAATAANQSTGNTSIAAVNTVLGAKTDAKSTATDTTSVSAMQVLKQISASVQSALTAADLEDAYSDYEVIAASQTDATVGTTGAIGDYLSAVIIHPATVGCDPVVVKDGGTTIYTFPGGGTTPLPALVPVHWTPGIKAKNSGGFTITTGANVAVMAVGAFT